MGLSTFICRDEAERAWLLDMHERIVPRERIAIAITVVLVVACAPWLPLVIFIPLALGGAVFAIGSELTTRLHRMEPLVAAWFAATLLISSGVVVYALESESGVHAYAEAIPLLIWPLLGACGGFPGRVVVVSTVWCCALAVIPALIWFGPEVVDSPPLVLIPVTLLLSAAVISSAVRTASMEHRNAAVIDQLTGMLNRTALATRVQELHHQSVLTGDRVAAIVLDLDHFKRVNDTHGHATGDRVLTDVAYVIRKELRAFDLAYRIGGEEFVVLLPGADEAQAEALGRTLCSAIREGKVAGLQITASIGVAVSPSGAPFDFAKTFRAADSALYEAKAAGRDRVVVSPPANRSAVAATTAA